MLAFRITLGDKVIMMKEKELQNDQEIRNDTEQLAGQISFDELLAELRL